MIWFPDFGETNLFPMLQIDRQALPGFRHMLKHDAVRLDGRGHCHLAAYLGLLAAFLGGQARELLITGHCETPYPRQQAPGGSTPVPHPRARM